MGRIANDGRGRIGGRKKGSKNKPKVQTELKVWVDKMTDVLNRNDIEKCIDGNTGQLYALLTIVASIQGATDELKKIRAIYEQATKPEYNV